MLGPLLVAAAAWGILTADLGAADDIAALDRRARANRSGVVLVGGSAAESALDPTALGDEYGPAAGLFLQGTGPVHWYAVLRDHVYGRGLRPERAVLYATPALWRAPDDAGGDLATLLDLVAPDDVVVRDHVFGGSRLGLLRARSTQVARRTRESFVQIAVRAGPWVITQVVSEPGGPPIDQVVRHAMAMTLVGPGQAAATHQRPEDSPPEAIGSIEESFLPAFAALAHTHGSRLLVVVGATDAPWTCDPRGFDPELVETLVGLGVDVLDLSALPYEPGSFIDRVHQTAAGRRQTTAAVRAAIDRLPHLPSGAPGRFLPPECP